LGLFVYSDSELYNSFSDFVSNYGLSQLVDQPTRGDNILDCVLCSDVLCCGNFSYLAPLANSNHCIVSFNLAVFLPVTSVADEQLESSQPNFRKANLQDFRCFLASINWIDELSGMTSPFDMWDRFIEIVNCGISIYVPCYKRNVHMLGHAKYPLRIKKMFHNKAKCWRLYRQLRTAEMYAKYKRISKACHCAVLHHLKHVKTKLVANGNLGSFYRYTNRKLNGSNGIAPLRDGDGKIITFSTDKAFC
jgi:hypothetical protein